MNIPPYLKQGSTIGITCPAGYVSKERVAYAITVLERWGFKVKLGKTIGTEHFYFSGTDAERLNDLQAMMDDPEIDAILMGRGGYGMSRIIDNLDMERFLEKPKWICGFSDITVLLNQLESCYDIPSLHSPMCGAFKPETENSDFLKSFYNALTGAPLRYNSPAFELNRKGTSEGVLIGGNLALITHLVGSDSEIFTDDKILFLEDIGEHLYKIDRMMLTLKRSGKLDHLKGLILGGFTEMEDTERPFGQTVEEIIADKVKAYNYPVCFHFPSGHQDMNYTLTMGMPHSLTVNENGGSLELIR